MKIRIISDDIEQLKKIAAEKSLKIYYNKNGTGRIYLDVDENKIKKIFEVL